MPDCFKALMWEGWETLSTAPTASPVPVLPPKFINAEGALTFVKPQFHQQVFHFILPNPLTLKPQLKHSLTSASESARQRPCEVGHMEQI